MNMKRNLLNVAVLASLGVAAGSAQAVYLGENGTGEVLIYPYYTVRDGYFTTMSVVNTTNTAKAVKVRYIEGKNSREVLDFNLYLSPNDVWTGAIEATTNGAKVSTEDTSCTAPALSTSQGGSGSQEFRNYRYTGAYADGEDGSLNRTREGYIEVIELGEVSAQSIPNGANTGTIAANVAVTHNPATNKPNDCAAITRAWGVGGVWKSSSVTANAALTEPMGGLFGASSMIRTDIGTDYAVDAVALDAFTNAVNHSEPGDTLPNLGNSQPKTSIVFNNGVAVTSDWTNLIDADPVSAVLMRSSVMNEYTVESIVNASTDWVVTFPTKRNYVYVDPTSATNADTVDRVFDRPFSDDFYTGGACEQVAMRVFDREENTPAGTLDFSPLPPSGTSSLCWEVNVLTFNGGSVLGSQLADFHDVNTHGYQNGWMRLSFPGGSGNVLHTTDRNNLTTRQMTSVDADTYYGLPVVGFAVQEYVRGDGSMDNYGGNFVHRYERSIAGN